VCDALGLFRATVAKKLNVSISSIQHQEKQEEAAPITRASISRAAAALDCELVVA